MEPPPPSSDQDYEYESASSAVSQMPPGFRFHPTDSEIIIHYLLNKVIDPRFRSVAIADIDLNQCEPWDLPQKAGKMVGEKEWFFFFEKETKYPSGTRTNRATASGYWKATGKDKEIIHRRGNMGINVVGMKKTLVFYKGRAPKGEKTNWVLHEYRLHGDFSAYKQISNSAKEKWVVCRVFHKKNATTTTAQGHVEVSRIDSLVDSPTPLTDYSSLSRKPSSTSAAQETYQIRPITTSSSTLMTSNTNMLQEFQQHHQNYNFLLDPYLNNYSSSTNPNHSSQNMNSLTLPYESPSLAYQDGLSSSMVEWYLTNFPIKGGETDDDYKSNEADHVYVGGKETERVCKMEAISLDNSAISPSHDTGLSTEMATAGHEINWERERESKKADDAVAEGTDLFRPNISDMDSLWSY